MKKLISLLLLPTLFLVSCNNTSTPSITPPEEFEKEEPACLICRALPSKEKTVHDDFQPHTPTTFNSSTVKHTTNELSKGVIQKKWTFTKNNGDMSQVVTIEIDLNYATIASGTFENQTTTLTLSTIHNQAIYYEAYNPNKTVIAATNADFFGNNKPVNAFVKDSIIIKDSHNDNGIYDYQNSKADLPASKPMLFGISGKTAQIAPIISNGTIEETVKSKLSYQMELLRNDTFTYLTDKVTINKFNEKNNINIVYNPLIEATAQSGSIVLKMKKHEQDSTRIHGEIISIETVTTYTTYNPTNDEYYIVVPESLNISDFQIGDVISYYITSPDDTWKYFDTIIGCRHSLIENGQIATTLNLENSNGAKTTNVPRTAIGILPNGNVVIFSVESLRYGKKSSSESDPYGLNLNELADFMRYYGIYNGANLDGGGSTQLLTKNKDTEQFEVIVRSSDYGTYNVEASRKVINSLLIVTNRNNE